jgi:hypothetical protein
VGIVIKVEHVDLPGRQLQQAFPADLAQRLRQGPGGVVAAAQKGVDDQKPPFIGHLRVREARRIGSGVVFAGIHPHVPGVGQELVEEVAGCSHRRQHVQELVNESGQSLVVGGPDGFVPGQEQRGKGLVEEGVFPDPRVAEGERLGIPQVRGPEPGVGESAAEPPGVAGVVNQVNDRMKAVICQVVQNPVGLRPVIGPFVGFHAMPSHRVPQPAHSGRRHQLQVLFPGHVMAGRLENVLVMAREVGAFEPSDDLEPVPSLRLSGVHGRGPVNRGWLSSMAGCGRSSL